MLASSSALKPRSKFFAFLTLTLLSAALFGCNATAPASAVAGSDPAGASAASEYVVHHMNGDTVMKGPPKKIAVLDHLLADSLLAVGIKPYAMTTYLGTTDLPYLDGAPFKETIALGEKANLEAVLQAQPDLILARSAEAKAYDQLSKIAPTVIVANAEDWREGFKDIAKIVRKEKEADQWLQAYDQKAAELRDKLKPVVKPGETFLYLRVMRKEIRVHGVQHALSNVLFQDLKLTPVAGIEKLDRIVTVSLEQLPAYNADHIFLEIGAPIIGGDKEAAEVFQSISESTVWKDLKAVKSGHVYKMPEWIISDYPHIKSKSLALVEQHLAK